MNPSLMSEMLSSSSGSGLPFRHSLEQYSPGSPFQLGLPHPGVAHSAHGRVPGAGGDGGGGGGSDSGMFGLNVVVVDGGRGVMPTSPKIVLTMGWTVDPKVTRVSNS